jgi:hypothetical protein
VCQDSPVIEPIKDLEDGVIGISAVGQFTIEDYSKVIEPAVAELEEHHDKLRLLLFLGPEFTGFGEGAWSELTDEIRHTHFHGDQRPEVGAARGRPHVPQRRVRQGAPLGRHVTRARLSGRSAAALRA